MRRNPDGTFMILNPGRPKKRGKGKRRAKAKAKRSPARRAYHHNPAPKRRTRRRRAYAHNPSRRRRAYRRNPSRAAGMAFVSPLKLPKLGQLDLGFAAFAGAGLIGHGMATNLVAQHVPVEQLKSGPGKFGLGVGVGAIGSWVAWKFLPRNVAVPLIAGMSASVAAQAFNTFVASHLPQLPVSGYESMELLSGLEDADDELGGVMPYELQGVGESERFTTPY